MFPETRNISYTISPKHGNKAITVQIEVPFGASDDQKLGIAVIQAVKEGLNLSGMRLRFAELENANLSGAVLSYADLSYANLKNANLSSADLYQVDFFKTDLTGTNFNDCSLRYADVSYAKSLDGASFVNATLNKFNQLSEKIRVIATLQGAVWFP